MSSFVPDLVEFSRLCAGATVVPVSREILADVITPVAAKATVGSAPGSFLLESVVGGEKWARFSFVGFDPELIVRGVADVFERIEGGKIVREEGVDPWMRLRDTMSRYVPAEAPFLPRFWGGAVGYTSYESVRRFEPKVGPALTRDDAWEFSFGIGATLLIFDNVRQTIRVVVPARIDGDPAVAHAAATKRIDAAIARLRTPVALPPLRAPDKSIAPATPKSSFDKAGFEAAVVRAQENIRAGDIFQVVLSQRFEVPKDGVDIFDVYRMMRQLNPSPYMFQLDFDDVRIAGASPETLVRMEHGVATVRPIAGTRHRGTDEASDLAIGEELMADPKERAEHVMLVDLGRNDLGRVSAKGTVRVTERMIIERYSHVMHIVSNVEGDVEPGKDALDVLRATFPAGTLSGAPKVRAMQIIEATEPVKRGIYGGAVGYLGFDGNLDVAIAIRTVVEKDGQFLLQAGAGIVEASDPTSEYVETLNKARANLIAIESARAARRDVEGM